MNYEPMPAQRPSRAFIWRPGCKRLIPEKPASRVTLQPCNPDAHTGFAFVSGIINRNPKKH
jgi:hypothetical protein